MDEQTQTPWWRTPFGLVLCGFLAVAAFFLLTEHTAHLFGALPYLLLAACPLMHVFMHHGHHGHATSDDRRSSTEEGRRHEPPQH